MDTESASSPRLRPPPIPEEGLEEVLRAWAGRGQLLEALTLVDDDHLERQWSRRDTERRANRVLYEELLPSVGRWPRTLREWLEVIPAESVKKRLLTTAPASASWTETRRLGWPPSAFVSKPRQRVADSLLVSVLRWTLDSLLQLRDDAISVDSTLGEQHRAQVENAAALLHLDPVASAAGEVPTRVDLLAASSEGRPWPAVAAVARRLKELNRERVDDLARRLLNPDFDWRLFHLAVLGSVLKALREGGWNIVSLRPLAGNGTGPAYQVTSHTGTKWELWFEGAGAWKFYGVKAPYRAAMAGLSGTIGSLGPDMLLIRKDVAALIIECKYPRDWDTEYVGRNGYAQMAAYAIDTREALAPEVDAVVVAPEGVVLQGTYVDTLVGRLGVAPPNMVGEQVLAFLSGHDG